MESETVGWVGIRDALVAPVLLIYINVKLTDKSRTH